MRNSNLNILDLFCGCGGLSFGFEKAGYNVLVGIDNDEAALRTFENNHKGAKSICGDITQVSYEADIKPLLMGNKIDVIVGGPPCQGMSLSGPRKFDDPRNKLYLSYIRLVQEIQPQAFVIENVPGLLGLFKGAIRDSILEKFESLGYHVEYKILCAADYGVPQSRNRVFFVGLKDENKRFVYPMTSGKIITCEDALSDLPPLTDSLGEDAMLYASEPKNAYQKLMRKKSNDVRNHIAALHSSAVKDTIALVPDGGNYKDLPEELRNSRKFNVAWTRFSRYKPAPTIDTGHRHHFHYEYNRVPTVRECARLQSFHDDFVFTGNKTQQFRQVGNAVPPILAQRLANSLLKCLKGDDKNV